MSRSTTVRVVNATGSALTFVDRKLSAGRWNGEGPAAHLPSGGTATFVNTASGLFGSANGSIQYASENATVGLQWKNPFVGRNSYRMAVDHDSIGCVCDGDDDDQHTSVSFVVVPSRKVTVPSFLPSTHGFHFRNSWTGEPLKRINLRIGTVPIGKASNGLCGGMVFAVRDFYEARRPIPSSTVAPPDKSPLRTYVIDRLIDSFDLPGGVIPYATIMSTWYPADDGDIAAELGQVASRATLLSRRMWPQVKATIDAGHPCPLGLVMVVSNDPKDLRHQHQVLAYGYQLRGTKLTLWVYDPNSPNDNKTTITFDTSRTDQPVEVHHTVDVDGPLVCGFVPRYVATTPPDIT